MVDQKTLWGRFAGCQKGSPRGFPVVGRGGRIVGLGGWRWRTFWELGEGLRCDGWLAGSVVRGGVNGAAEGDATEAEGHADEEVLVCATVARAGRSFKNGLDNFLLVSARFFTTKMSFAGRRRGNKVKKGVQFTLMVVGAFFLPVFLLPLLTSQLGASGTGRTTFVNTLCESEVLAHKVADNPESAHIEEGIRIKPANVGTAVSRSTCSLPSNSPLPQNSRRMAFVLLSPSLTRLVLVTTLTMSSR